MNDKPKLNLRGQANQVTPAEDNETTSSRRHSILGAGGVLLVLFVGVLIFLAQDSGDISGDPVNDDKSEVQAAQTIEEGPTYQKFEDPELGLTLDFNQTLRSEPLSEQDTEAGYIARLSAQDPPVIITVRQETGLRAVAALSQTDTATLLKRNIDKSLPSRYPGFDQSSSTTATINGKGVIERIFTYTGPSGEVAKQRLLAFIKDDNTAVYVSMQTTDVLYDTVAVEFFDPLQGSIHLN